MKAKILAENLVKGSGGHGIKQDILEHIFAQHEDKLDDRVIHLEKCLPQVVQISLVHKRLMYKILAIKIYKMASHRRTWSQ